MLTWRWRRHTRWGDDTSSIEVVRRVLAVRGWPARVPALAVGVRTGEPAEEAIASALSDGALVRSYAFRGGSYVFAPEVAADLLAVRTITRIWETDRWQRQAEIDVPDWEPVREGVLTALADGPRTRAEIADHLRRDHATRSVADAAASGAGADTLDKPLHWWGDICFGPERDGTTTFRRLDGHPDRPGAVDPDEAGPRAVRAYLAGYGPATAENLRYWFTEGLGVPRRRLEAWVADLCDVDELVAVTVDGERRLARATDAEEMAGSGPDGSDPAVGLLPGFDPWVLGPGTADATIVPPARRALFSAGRDLVVVDGVVSGTWRRRGTAVTVSWFPETGRPPVDHLRRAVARLAKVEGVEAELLLEEAA